MPYYPINSKHKPDPDPTYIRRLQEEYLRDFFGDAGYEALSRAGHRWMRDLKYPEEMKQEHWERLLKKGAADGQKKE